MPRGCGRSAGQQAAQTVPRHAGEWPVRSDWSFLSRPPWLVGVVPRPLVCSIHRCVVIQTRWKTRLLLYVLNRMKKSVKLTLPIACYRQWFGYVQGRFRR